MKKGFSLIVLSIVIAVMVITTTAVVVNLVATQNQINKLAFAEELSILQEKVNNYYIKNNSYPVDKEGSVASINIADLDDEQKKQFAGEVIEANNVKLSYLKMELMYDMSEVDYTSEYNSLKYGKKSKSEKDVYLVSQNTGKVYYQDGFDKHYTLDEELKNAIYYVDAMNLKGISFVKSTEEYTNKPIVTKIKVPKNYIVSSLEIKDDKASSYEVINLGESGEYKEYTTPNNIYSNYTIILKWKENENGSIINTVYRVSNYDSVPPLVKISDSIYTSLNLIKDVKEKMYYIDYSDNLSGIEIIKYTDKKIISETDDNNTNLEVISSYMGKNGNVITNNNIKVTDGTRFLTIYAKDKAGNESYIIREITQTDKFKIKYDLNGGIGNIPDQEKAMDEDIKITSTVPTKEKHTFLGWSTEKNDVEAVYKSNDNYAKNESATLYAVWETAIPITIRLVADGATNSYTREIFRLGNKLYLDSEFTQEIELNKNSAIVAPTKSSSSKDVEYYCQTRFYPNIEGTSTYTYSMTGYNTKEGEQVFSSTRLVKDVATLDKSVTELYANFSGSYSLKYISFSSAYSNALIRLPKGVTIYYTIDIGIESSHSDDVGSSTGIMAGVSTEDLKSIRGYYGFSTVKSHSIPRVSMSSGWTSKGNYYYYSISDSYTSPADNTVVILPTISYNDRCPDATETYISTCNYGSMTCNVTNIVYNGN